jgi:hypothetical protein
MPTPAVSASDARAALQKEAARKQVAAQAVKMKAPRTKKAAIPENLAEQYGAKLSKRVESGKVDVPVADAPKKRLTKAEREARKQLLRPDEGLMERLQRATPVVTAKKVAKPRGWRFECGRCGRVLHFQTPGALCECGAIAVKD